MTGPEFPGLLLLLVTARSAAAVTVMFAVGAVLLAVLRSVVLPPLMLALLVMVPRALALSTSVTVAVAPLAKLAKEQVTGPVPVQVPVPLGVAETKMALLKVSEMVAVAAFGPAFRSEERRVGKEGRSRWSPDH